MVPKSISASSLEISSRCMAAYKAAVIQRGSGIQNPAALLGTALHAALEDYTSPQMIQLGAWDFNILGAMWAKAFMATFNEPATGKWFDEGKEILRHWHSRPGTQESIEEANILSREQKHFFEVPCVIDGVKSKIPFNYIMDRLDDLGEDTLRVVDYKSQRVAWSASEMFGKIQPRAYALAAQILCPNAQAIWVEYDFLRHERVAVMYTRDDNITTWDYVKKALQRIIDTPFEDPKETINENCRYCIRKMTCNALKANTTTGGIFGSSIDDLSERYYELKSQAEALKYLSDEIEVQLLAYAKQEDEQEWTSGNTKIKIGSSNKRQVDQDKIREILGDTLYGQIGKVTVPMIEELRRDPRLNDSQRSLLNSSIVRKQGELSVRATRT